MSRSDDRSALADLLAQLKDRSGLSYAALARKTNISRSSVHRFCSGAGLPPDFGTVERIATACGASKADLDSLYRLWSHTAQSPAEEPLAEATEPTPGTPEPGPSVEAPAAPRSRHGAVRWIAAAAAVALAVLALAVVGTSGGEPTGPAEPTADSAPPWTQAPAAVSPHFFGVTINSSTGAMPTFRVGAVRLWDSRTRWANLQPRRGQFDWSILDRLVAGAQAQGLPVLFTIGGTPEWAAPTSPRSTYADGSRTGPPDDLADWDAFIRTLAERYQDRIQAYELWVVANDSRFFSGDPATLAEMTARASKIIKAVDRRAAVICPSMGRLWENEGRTWFERFAATRAYDHCDAAGVKLHQRQASDPPETLAELITLIDRTFHKAGIHPKVWNTGTSYETALAAPLDEDTAADHAVRFYLAGLYGQVNRMYFYSWGGVKLPIVLQRDGGPPTRAALHVEELQRWLRDAAIESCGHGTGYGLPASVWQCRFRGADGRPFLIVWAERGSARMPAPPGVREIRHLDGTTTAQAADLPVTTRPILVTL
ncbi:Beta-galactosidase [Actinokineospora alba]|uniref:Beta-galactosidase n=1 Tax=Actinokineospora alba TaxID=504798 RepID=A0A1H0QNJ7_9PSEU|nr:helix-turn-helix domain-containing protein [Actinokineospora alba]TDP70468.1 beta-galactosidase-like protein [Actinokineospora alba]SDI30928.1 Beta-galactosidase [Actinokineospora alba]SDP18904.1 Beta-galactosidase [Actinokineospora alba]